MSINVDFYNFKKRLNSTKIPSEIGQTFSCTLKDDCSILNPVIRLTGANASFKPVNYNYARIADFGRYYFVTDWKFSQGCWHASLNVDELGSWKDDIGNSSQYILRTSTEAYNPHLCDNQYIATSGVSSVVVEAEHFMTDIALGVIVVGILSNLGADVAPITYYVFSYQEFRQFCEKLYSRDFFEQFELGISNPIDYITSCVWLPISKTSLTTITTESVFFGIYKIDTRAGLLTPQEKNYISTLSISFECVKHPQIVNRGPYMNINPYTRRTIYWSVIGEIPVDTTLCENANTIDIKFSVDVLNGNSTYIILADNWKFINSGTCSIGVLIPLSQQSINTFGILQNEIGAIASLASESVTGTIGNVVNGISNLMPQVRRNGNGGSFASYLTDKPCMRNDFVSVVEQDINRFGRPCCEVGKILYRPGFILCQNADFSATGATKSEIDVINNFMNGGFYYE